MRILYFLDTRVKPEYDEERKANDELSKYIHRCCYIFLADEDRELCLCRVELDDIDSEIVELFDDIVEETLFFEVLSWDMDDERDEILFHDFW